MHFGPEWMRTKGSSRPAPSPPLTSSPAPPGSSTYSALVTPASNPPPEGRDVAHPFRYSKEEMLRIYKEGGGRGGLGLEVERWEGIVREVGYDPVGLKDMGDAEKKLFAGPLNSEVRRRQSTDFLSPLNTSGLGERPKLNHATSAAGSPMRERIGSFMGRRRGDSTGDGYAVCLESRCRLTRRGLQDQAPLALPRKLSISNMQGGLASPREGALPSPRVRPGFDGVLSDTWSARRRTSENVPKGGGKGDKETDGETKDLDIKEEEEDAIRASEQAKEPAGGTSGGVNGEGTSNGVEQVNGQLGNVSISGQDGQPAQNQPPPGLADLSTIDWSYLDPQGQIQGPFKADLMQRWYNEGYFQANLLMKRTHLDTDWTPVGELVRRVGEGQPVFLSPLVHNPTPPGLPRPAENVVDRAVPERNQHSPYQPVPMRSVRSATLDSYLQNSSSASDSPSSSFGGRFANGSPDPAVFDNRQGAQFAFDQPEQSRMPFATPSAGAMGTPQRRATQNETVDPMLGTRYAVGRNSGTDGLGFGGPEGPGIFNDGASPFAQRIVPDSGALNGLGGSSALNGGAEFGPIGGIHSSQGTPSRVLNRDPFGRPAQEELQQGAALGGSFSNHSSPFIPHAQAAFPQTPLSQFAGQDNRSLHSMTPERPQIPFIQQLQQPFAQSPSFVNSQSPWHTQEAPAFRRPGPFDANHPTSSNTFISQPAAPSQPFGRVPQGSIQTDQSPWQTPIQPVQNDPWGTQTASLTAANLGQHDEQQRQAELRQQVVKPPPQQVPPEPEPAPVPVEEPQPQPSLPAAVEPIFVTIPSPVDVAPQKPRRKSTAQIAPAAPPAPKVAPPAPAPAAVSVAPLKAPSPISQAETKAAWAVEDDKKKGSAPTLREIQEAEAKKAEARKAEQRERERAERAVRTSSQSEDFQSFTTSWGLPTSQAGTRSNSNGPKEAPVVVSPFNAPVPVAPSPAVWTNAAKSPVAKKTMKEIQEEEERKRKLAKEKESMAAAARRGYADTTTKPSGPTPPTGGAWTTVGANGKSTAATIAATAVVAARPGVTPTASAKVVPTASAVPASSGNTSRPSTAVAAARPAAVAVKSASSKDESPAAPGPSLEFLKWLGDSLKGLNNSVNLEELTSMLLSFPLDPDPSTVEIISDLVYASSTTLDGRRFASEFVSKRKADAVSRPKGASASGTAKAVSIADVVKTQPKPAQNEWGGFKVVNKKKKGGRS
ncbi:hypothetical protein GSI_07044 [Ganoderma sinense ZZ0214-1]|uniref:GYF domain-containing protein n=1 Tax=Ganoderma sinense ZZ0214-1 TaxID=1077348 RepID=A0A2G8SAT6_9APHY|nr:hypothetical protein GSI_07044 [Ganoderma sinense ZZ0214-1]